MRPSTPEHKPDPMPKVSLRHRAEAQALRAIIAPLMRLPLARRVALMGRASSALIAPVAGYRARIRENLAHVMPDLPATEVTRLVRNVPNNMGRALIEQLSGAEFAAHAASTPLAGPGLDAMAQAKAEDRPVILVTGHLGNHLAGVVALRAQGFDFGGLYMPLHNRIVNTRYVAALEHFLNPPFPRGREGLGAMLRHLREGRMLGMLIDQDMEHGAVLDFMGKPARTALSAAELALKFDAVLVPGYAIRQPDGLTFRATIEAPVPHSDAATMTQVLNDSLSAQVRLHMDQWLWTHRRWKA